MMVLREPNYARELGLAWVAVSLLLMILIAAVFLGTTAVPPVPPCPRLPAAVTVLCHEECATVACVRSVLSCVDLYRPGRPYVLLHDRASGAP
jgi:hypothetical protein